MAKFQIATPGGFEVEVSAQTEDEALNIARQKWETMPRIVAKQDGDVRVFERNDGTRYLVAPGYSTTDPDKIAKVLEGQSAGEVSKTSIDESLIAQYPVAARAAEYVRGTPFVGSYADEALSAALGPQVGTGMRAVSGAMERQRPIESAAIQLGSGLLTTAGALSAAPKLAGLGGTIVGQGPRAAQMARGAALGMGLGGAEGAIYGAGEGQTAGERAKGAAVGGGIGAVLGGALGGAAPLATTAFENVARLFKRSDIDTIAKELNISSDAAKVIKATFDKGGDIQAATAALNRAGKEAMLADAGPAAQALLDAVVQSGGTAARTGGDAISQRMTRTNAAINDALGNTLGASPEGPRTAVAKIAQASAPARKAAYDAAYQTPINYASDAGYAIEGVLNKVSPDVLIKAVKEANDDMRANGIVNQQIMAMIGDNGDVIFREMPNVQQLDEIKKALQAIAYENTDDFGKLTGKGQRYSNLATELRDAVGNAVPSYLDAVKIGGDKIAEERAFKLGADLLRTKTNVEDVMLELGDKPSTAQLASAKQGLRSYIDTMLGNVRSIASDPNAETLEARQVIKAVLDMSSDNSRKKIKSLLGAEADALLAQIDEAAQSASVYASMAQNSKTAARLAQKQTIEQITEPGVVQHAMKGEFVGTTKGLIQNITGMTGEYTEAQKQRIYQDIARALTEKGGDDARLALNVLDKAMQGQALTDAQVNSLSRLVSGVLFTGAAPAATKATQSNVASR